MTTWLLIGALILSAAFVLAWLVGWLWRWTPFDEEEMAREEREARAEYRAWQDARREYVEDLRKQTKR